MKSVADARLSIEVLGRWLRHLRPESPSVRGGLGVFLTMLLVLLAAPIVMRAAIWWWSLWLQFPR